MGTPKRGSTTGHRIKKQRVLIFGLARDVGMGVSRFECFELRQVARTCLSSPHSPQRSKHCLQHTFVRFVNACEVPVKLYWFTYSGEKRLYITINPGKVYV